MTNQAKIKTATATLVPAIDHNAIANKASSDFVRALGNPRNALVQLNTLFQSVAVTRGTQSMLMQSIRQKLKGQPMKWH